MRKGKPNNASSALMIWSRKHLVGKLWIPKHGDSTEFPLMPEEVDELRSVFNVRVEYPELFLFRMVAAYLLRGRLWAPFKALDRIGYRVPALRRRSHIQHLYLS